MERISQFIYERNLNIMKKFLALFLCLMLAVSCVAVFASCDKNTKDPAKTEAPTQTEAPTDTTADSTSDDTAGDDETTEPSDTEEGDGPVQPAEGDVVISSVEDLMAFNKAVNEDYLYYDFINVIFKADIDLTGYEWTPLYGDALNGVTFVGNGHTISNMTINYNTDGLLTSGPDLELGAGFVGVASHQLYFEDLNFNNCYIKAYERYVGCVVGRNLNGEVYMENVKVSNFKVDGWTDIDNKENHEIGFRIGGLMGSNHGMSYFENCHVENIELTGYHNLAGLVGFDQAGSMDEFSFVDCSVKNAKFNFSYGMKYDVNQAMKYVTVFCNFTGYVNKTDACVEMGNSYEGVSYYDIHNGTEYLPGDFVTPDAEEEAPAA